ncbi:MAG: bacteriocin fulvocin C-related protein [Solirubrobacteraceae bacterium]
MGADADWAPTLLRVDANAVRGWTGAAMSARLAGHLGPRLTLRVLRSLGELRGPDARPRSITDSGSGPAVSRGGFMKLVSGTALAGAFALRSASASAAPAEHRASADWVAARRGRLPERYDDVVALPLAYRKAIYRASTPEVRSRLWSEQLTRFRVRDTRAPAEVAAVDSVLAFVADATAFDFERRDHARVQAELQRLKIQTIHALGTDRARRLIATLGPEQPAAVTPDATVPGCNCNITDSWCDDRCIGAPFCICGAYCCDCGTLWGAECNGQCVPEPACG